jgi:hypothetical protein
MNIKQVASTQHVDGGTFILQCISTICQNVDANDRWCCNKKKKV